MIDESFGIFTLICDNCNYPLEENFDSYGEAIKAKKDNGWTNKMVNGQWKDICEECGGAK